MRRSVIHYGNQPSGLRSFGKVITPDQLSTKIVGNDPTGIILDEIHGHEPLSEAELFEVERRFEEAKSRKRLMEERRIKTQKNYKRYTRMMSRRVTK